MPARLYRVQGDNAQPVFVMNEQPGSPQAQKSAVANTTSTIGNNTIVAAPAAGWRIRLWAFLLVNEAGTAITCTIRDQAARFRETLAAAIGSGPGWAVFPWGYPLNEATALTLALSAATAVGYSFVYSIEEV